MSKGHIEFIRVTNKDTSSCSLTWKQQANGLFSTFTNHYGVDGYYKAHLSTSKANIPFSAIIDALDTAKALCFKVEVF